MTDIHDQDEDTSPTAPGKVLRGIRESQGMTQADVANRLRLSVQSIKDIEADDYFRFSAAIYVRGYLRNYAALLKIDNAPLLAAFNSMRFVDQINPTQGTSYIASSITKTAHSNRSKRRVARWMSGVVFLLLIGLVAAWWYGQRHHQHAIISNNLLTQAAQPAQQASQHLAIPMTVKNVVVEHKLNQKRK
ncbi:MAG: hypothetical protein COB66_08985 [Coxiella sp. (in: Bacteria)]|nr:MAG: hypothetical protein COB66_08985 [Coxiella sp. (in: g-proteobacteria)]